MMCMSNNHQQMSKRFLMEKSSIWTLNATPGKRVYGEQLKRFYSQEYRRWDPYRSKIAAALLRTKQEPENLLPKPGSHVLYLGAGHGTTISHVHDLVCGSKNQSKGRIVGVDISPRCIRDLLLLSEKRPGFIPILADARKNDWQNAMLHRVDWLFQDVSQTGQLDIFLETCANHLKPDAKALFSFKMASERWTDEAITNQLESMKARIEHANFVCEEVLDLQGYEDEHFLFVIRNNE